MSDVLYYALVGAFLAHELDAVRRHEWRILPLTSFLPDPVGAQVFIWAHVPLITLILWGGDGSSVNSVRLGLAGFSILHVGLHVLFRRHPDNEFNTVASWGLILLTGGLGCAYLVAALG
ncbi:DUF6713 family protein [uncultured Shimia sp.]|uniref:DUF6713 family protein n=1 Tax=uncultured Shimia sp. TaxID=573152 RepID=UPI00262FE25D|nr:DUF6713 family protein [uncultured Shimia sp.]